MKKRTLLGAVSAEQVAANAKRRAEWKALTEAKALEEETSGGGAMMRMMGNTVTCVTNAPLYITNTSCLFVTNRGWVVTFDVQGTNGPADIFMTTNLVGNHITNAAWVWLERGPTCATYQYTNQPTAESYYILGTMLDADGDGLTDAFEKLVSKTNPSNADTDNDGMLDAWEVHNGLNPLTNDAGDDPDGDWLTNLQEYNGGANSTDPHDVMVVAWGLNSSGQCSVPTDLRGVVAIAGGFDFSLALRKNGTVVPWGANDYGQTNIPTGLTNAATLSARWWDGATLKADGTMKRWGASPWSVPSWATNLSRISVGYDYVMGLQSNGTVIAWGQPSYRTNLIPGLTNIIEIAASTDHKVALRNNGTVVAWGLTYDYAGWNLTNVPAAATNVTAISAGEFHTLALKASGTVVAWGAGNILNPSTTYLGADLGQSVVPAGLSNVVTIAASGYHSLALRADGSVVGWGDISTPSFLQSNVIAIASGQNHNLAIRGGRQLPLILKTPVGRPELAGANVTYTSQGLGLAGVKYQWQFNGVNLPNQTNANLMLSGISTTNVGNYTVVISTGAGSVTSSIAPLSLIEPPVITNTIPSAPSTNYLTNGVTTGFLMTVQASALATDRYPLRYQWLTNSVAISGATNQSYFITPPWVALWQTNPADGNYTVQVSNPAGTNQSAAWTVKVISPFREGSTIAWGNNSDGQVNYPTNLTNTLAISAGKYHSVTVREDGGLEYWGYAWASLPTDLTNLVSVSAGYAHTLVLRDNGTLTAWGQTNAYANSVPTNNHGIKSVAAGTYHNVAVQTNGSVIAWGLDFPGWWNLLAVPSSVTNVTAVAAGTYHSLALKADGTVVSWGYNGSGQTNVPSGLSNVVAIAAGEEFSLALKKDGTVVGWGINTSGQCTPPVGLSNVMAIAAGWAHSAALKNDGTVVCWGANSSGQTSTPSGLTNVKLIAAGGDHTLAGVFSPLVQYPVDVSKDLLLIYNTNSVNSIVVKDYYLAHRPMVGGANVLGVGATTNEIISTADFTNQIQTPYLNWQNQNPTKHPQYVILFPDLPTRNWSSLTNAAINGNSVAFDLHRSTPGVRPFVTSINMGLTYGTNNWGALTNDCIAYINKLATFGSNYSPGQLFISASKGGYANTNFVLENLRHGAGWPIPEPNFSTYGTIISSLTNLVLNFGLGELGFLYNDGVEVYGQPSLPHITNAVNVAGYMCWGGHSSLGNEYPVNQQVNWTGDSSWWIIETIESFNGWRETGQGNFTQWFSQNAFGGTNYSNTPVGAVTHTDEPGLFGVNNPQVFFGLWVQGKTFSQCGWQSRITPKFQAVGDPFVRR